MAERTIRSGIGTYQRPDGQWTHGVLGDVVDVHEDDLERFDRLNPPEPEVVEPDPDAEGDEAPVVTEADLAAAVKAVEDEARNLAEAKAELARERAQFESEKAAAAGTTEPYEGVKVADLKAEIDKRNEGRGDDDKISPAEPGNRPELVAALVADDARSAN